jgi:hypothetical protein
MAVRVVLTDEELQEMRLIAEASTSAKATNE